MAAVLLGLVLATRSLPVWAADGSSDRVAVWGHEAEVTPLGATELRIAVDGEEWTFSRVGAGSNLRGPSPSQVDIQLVEAIVAEWQRLHPGWAHPSPRRSPWQYVGGLAVIGLGAAQVRHPRFFWYLSEGWKFRDAEPSDLALGLGRLGGVVTIIVGLVIFFH